LKSLVTIFAFVFFSLHAHSKDVRSEPKKKPTPKKVIGNSRPLPVRKASELEVIEKAEEKFTLYLEARRFAQGEVVLLRIKPHETKWLEDSFRVVWMGRELPIARQKQSQIAFLPIPPETKPGSTILEIHSKNFFLDRGVKRYEIELHPTAYTVIKKHTITVDNKYVTQELSPETLAFIQECVKAKEAAFSSQSVFSIFQHFTNPLDSIFITSPFYVRRDYNNKKGRPHGGVDFRGKEGTPIYAVQEGTVVLARKMYYEGNFTILDHGHKIFTLYMHQHEILVKEGDHVKRGQMIGKVGSTGMSTGPHLHLGAKVGDVLVNPLSLLALQSIRESN